MKTIWIKIGIGFLLSIGFLLLWMLGFGLSQAVFKVEFPSTNEDPGTSLALMYLISVLEVGALLIVHYRLQGSIQQRFLMIFTLLFGLQFVMSQVETLAFQSAVGITTLGIVQILTGGLLLAAGFSVLLVGLDRKRGTGESIHSSFQPGVGTVLLLLLVIYPMLYIAAGYFIAWQFPAIRQYYTNSPSNKGFYAAFVAFFKDGLYFLQVGRAFLWLLIALPILRNYRGTRLRTALMLGTTFSVVHCAQLLLPNPFMPAAIRGPHLLETASSTFVWGFVLAYLCWRKKAEYQTTINDVI